ncbi:hypothetical protein VNO80_12333 [Phaseolus coccineus]|uniref:Uncharacterized protein n=1 Tax=Phaseolus coccineus TaxID=3886 RepID=A0AAN9N667_PHACN
MFLYHHLSKLITPQTLSSVLNLLPLDGKQYCIVGLHGTVGAGENEPFHYQLGRIGGRFNGNLMVSLVRLNVDQRSNAEKVNFVISDIVSMFTFVEIAMGITETNYIRIDPCRSLTMESINSTKTNESFDAWGGVVDTTVHLYGSGSRWGLLVVESKKKRREEEAEVANVAHYFVKSSGTSLHMSTRTDIGLSVVAKCGVSNGKFDITVEGPEEHPVCALLYILTVKTVTVFPYQYLVPPPKVQDGSPMVEGSRETMRNSIRRVGLLGTVGAGENEPFHYQLGRIGGRTQTSADVTARLQRVQNRSRSLGVCGLHQSLAKGKRMLQNFHKGDVGWNHGLGVFVKAEVMQIRG